MNIRYLITYTENKIAKAFYTKWFDAENNFNASLDMKVYDLSSHNFTIDGINWMSIDFDNL